MTAQRRGLVITALGALYVHGCTLDWQRVRSGAARHVALPTYPWQRSRHWWTDPVPTSSGPPLQDYEIAWVDAGASSGTGAAMIARRAHQLVQRGHRLLELQYAQG